MSQVVAQSKELQEGRKIFLEDQNPLSAKDQLLCK